MNWIQKFFMMLCTLNVRQEGQHCTLHTRTHFGEPLPVIIRNGRLLEPTDNSGNVDIDYGESIQLSCEGSGHIIHSNTNRDVATGSVTCRGGETFENNEWLSAPAQFSSFRCPYPPNYSSRRTNRTCYEGNRIFEVGYNVENQFYPLYESCFNEVGFRPIYSTYTQKPYNAEYQTRVDRPYFIADDVFGSIPVESLYSPKGLKAAVARLVGPLIDTYITNSEFLSRGHLAAKTDFVFAFGERATFHYVNCAPQWYGLNGGNWNTLEVDLRNHIHFAAYNTIIYTGTHGVTSLSTQYGGKVELYLYDDVNNNPVIPVPEYYYKAVYEISSKRGIVFVGINNPYYTLAEVRDLTFCPDVCRGNSNFNWLTWHPDNSNEGFTFCCTIQDFRRTIRHLPDFEVTGLLV